MSNPPLVLLGAGASAPAGIPTATDMTAEMFRRCETDGRHEYARALSAISGALQMGYGANNSRPALAGGVDVERVLNAAMLLGDRFALEFAPFVASWHPIIDDLERRQFGHWEAQSIAAYATSSLSVSDPLANFHRDESEFFRGHRQDRHFREAIRKALVSALQGLADHLLQRPDGDLFRNLSAYLTGKLIELTWLQSSRKLSYLDPLLISARSNPITVVTLNYDNTIELRAAAKNIPISTGIEEWSSTGIFPKPRRGIDLIKLHGSINWWWDCARQDDSAEIDYRNFRQLSNEDVDKMLNSRAPEEEIGRQLGIIFGGSNKILASGPFVDLLGKFKHSLNKHSKIIVIGYSFRDAHVNHCIAKWLHGDTKREITIIERPGARPDENIFCIRKNEQLKEKMSN